MTELNCVLVGNSNTGKTAWLTRHTNGMFLRNHVPTTTQPTVDLDFHTTHGPFTIKVADGWYPAAADCAIVMFDLTDKTSFDAVSRYINQIRLQYGPIPVLICGNKADLPGAVQYKHVYSLGRRKDCLTTNISAYSNFCIEYPVLFAVATYVDPSVKSLFGTPVRLIEPDLIAVA